MALAERFSQSLFRIQKNALGLRGKGESKRRSIVYISFGGGKNKFTTKTI